MVGLWGLAVAGWLLAVLDSIAALARQAPIPPSPPPTPGRGIEAL